MITNRVSQFTQTTLTGTGLFVTARPHHRARSRSQLLRCALQGLREAWRTQPKFRLHVYIAACATAAGVWFRLSVTEWLWVSFAVGLVIFAELMNAAIEQTVDLVVGLRPDPLARHVKEIAAACVLIATLLAGAIGTLTVLSHLYTSVSPRGHAQARIHNGRLGI